jgi:hypothetical protein
VEFDRHTFVLLVRPVGAPDELYTSDPAVQAGRLGIVILTWLTPAGNVRFEPVRRPRSTAETEG